MNEVTQPTTPMVEVDGYSFPKRIPGQEWIVTNLPTMEGDELDAFLALLADRRWTDNEFEVRILAVLEDQVA